MPVGLLSTFSLASPSASPSSPMSIFRGELFFADFGLLKSFLNFHFSWYSNNFQQEAKRFALWLCHFPTPLFSYGFLKWKELLNENAQSNTNVAMKNNNFPYIMFNDDITRSVLNLVQTPRATLRISWIVPLGLWEIWGYTSFFAQDGTWNTFQ